MMNNGDNLVNILYLNTRGQTKFTLEKQLQSNDLVRYLKCDIVHLQETDMDENVFEHCHFIKNNFNVIINNNSTGYGTASLVRNCLQVEDIIFDTKGRIIIFNINKITFCNIYLKAGTDSVSRAARENYCSSVLPNLLINRGSSGCCGGDWNSIICKKDATNHPESKLSPS